MLPTEEPFVYVYVLVHDLMLARAVVVPGRPTPARVFGVGNAIRRRNRQIHELPQGECGQVLAPPNSSPSMAAWRIVADRA
jgi:hypothetical protein